MTFKLFDFGETILVEPPHRCDLSCGHPCATYREIKELESKIAEMKERMSYKLDLHRGLRTKMNILHDPFVSRVPLEIATTIFLFCLPRSRDTVRFLSPTEEDDNAHALFTLGAVCKSWRQIVWSTPHFWSQISIYISPCTIAASTSLIQDWIDRSAQLPLSIHVYASTAYYELDEDEDEDSVDDIMLLSKVVNATSRRWEYLDLKLPPILLPMFHGKPANLRELRIHNTNYTRYPNPGLLTEGDGQKPKPTFVEFDFVRLHTLDISWSNVTCVKTKGIELQECLELLRRAPLLVECTFIMINSARNSWQGLAHVTHHTLRDLKVLFPLGGNDLCIDNLTLPGLESLAIQLYSDPLPTQSILSLIERSSCSLGSLDISAIFEEEALISMLREIPSLWDLNLTPSIVNNVFNAEGFFKLLAQTTQIIIEDDAGSLSGSESEAGSEADISSNTSTDKENFLPELEFLRYSQSRTEECERVWNFIPAAVGYSNGKEEDFDPDLPLRPLKSIMVTLDPPAVGMPSESLRPPGFISKPTLIQMKELLERGYSLDIQVSLRIYDEPEDFIASSIAFHEKERIMSLSVGES